MTRRAGFAKHRRHHQGLVVLHMQIWAIVLHMQIWTVVLHMQIWTVVLHMQIWAIVLHGTSAIGPTRHD